MYAVFPLKKKAMIQSVRQVCFINFFTSSVFVEVFSFLLSQGRELASEINCMPMKIHFFQHIFLAKEASSDAETAYNFPVFFLGLGPFFFNGPSPLVTPFQSIALLFCDTTDLAVKSTSMSLSMILCPYIRHHNEAKT